MEMAGVGRTCRATRKFWEKARLLSIEGKR